jgi:hypothetical protein
MIDDIKKHEAWVSYKISDTVDKIIDEYVDEASSKYVGKVVEVVYQGNTFVSTINLVDSEYYDEKYRLVFYIDLFDSEKNFIRSLAVKADEISFVDNNSKG